MSSIQLAAVAAPGPQAGTVLAEESWDSVWPEAASLTKEHSDEVDAGIEPRRRFCVDSPRMRALSVAGALRIFTARTDGKLVGYITWMVMPDLESQGLVIAQQGAWFVSRSAKSQNLGYRLFERSLVELKLLGVSCVFPHCRTQGRGAKIGAFFERWGAKHIQNTYCLWIGDF